MNTIKVNPQIEWRVINERKYLYFLFEGNFTKEDASQGVVKWRELMGPEQTKKELIWNCINMSGYKPEARIQWQKAITEHKDRIDIIWLITNSALIQAGARIMSLFTPYNFKVVKSEEDIKSI